MTPRSLTIGAGQSTQILQSAYLEREEAGGVPCFLRLCAKGLVQQTGVTQA
ncbi:hypothetical protein IMCC21224_113672 [Puniceibacterium sp. IMCC21224]|nr:hypothetical protein IMCC21224_113672 [Puniceibacterium sp. IMCC21224]